MNTRTQKIYLRHIHKIMGKLGSHMIDGIIGGIIRHPNFGELEIQSWELRSRGRSLALHVDDEGIPRTMDSGWLVEVGADSIEIPHRVALVDLVDACAGVIETESQAMQAQFALALQEDQERLWLNRLAQLWILENGLNVNRNSDSEERRRVFTLLVTLAREWIRGVLPNSPSGLGYLLTFDPIIHKSFGIWKAEDIEDRVRLFEQLRTGTDYTDAAIYLLKMESSSTGDMRVAVLISRMRTSSISGRAEQAGFLGREISDVLGGSINPYFALVIWEHYRRWTSIDPHGNMLKLLEYYTVYLIESRDNPGNEISTKKEEAEYFIWQQLGADAYYYDDLRGMTLNDDDDYLSEEND